MFIGYPRTFLYVRQCLTFSILHRLESKEVSHKHGRLVISILLILLLCDIHVLANRTFSCKDLVVSIHLGEKISS